MCFQSVSGNFIRPWLAMLLVPSVAFGDSTISQGARFAFVGNTGWINFRHDRPSSPAGVSFGDFFLSGHAHSANLGWIDFGDGSPANGIRYANGGSGDFGVNHDGRGNLSGFAYGANIGWINFGWAAADHPDRPRVNLLTGSFAGFAYGANIGWINLGSGFLTTTSMAIADSDGDGMADSWERQFFGDLATATPVTDSDHDGTSDKSEYDAGTAPNDPADYLRIVSTAFNGTFTQATVVFTTQPTRLYRLETSNALGVAPDAWQDSALGTFMPDAGTTTTRVISWPGAARKFIRAVAVRPIP